MKHFLSLFLILALVTALLCCPSFAAADNTPTVPKIEITTDSGNGLSLEKDDGYVGAHITVTDTDGSVIDDAVSLKVRGNSTAMTFVDKKSFNFKFAKKTDILGMGKGKKWAMLANCFDPTLMRNYLVLTSRRSWDSPIPHSSVTPSCGWTACTAAAIPYMSRYRKVRTGSISTSRATTD